MLFTTPPQNVADIRAFCAKFNEGLRVEYKSNFDDNVRRSLPKIVSSFANSLGGVLIVGVNAVNGVPQQPIEGFDTPAEELPLTVENICLQGINPPVIPRIAVIPSDVANRTLLLIEIDESWEAPHAIENSKRVYVRTGNAANPYDLAEVDLIIELMKRRAGPSSRREHLIAAARERATTVVPDAAIHMQVSIVPSYPRRVLCANDMVWTFLSRTGYRRGHYFPLHTLRRIEDGVASFNRGEEYSQVSTYGLLFTKQIMELHGEGQGPQVILLRDIFHPLVKLLHCAETYYTQVGFRGNIEVEVGVYSVRGQRMPFLSDRYGVHTVDDYECFEQTVRVSQRSSAELLREKRRELMQDLLRQMCWSFWQSGEDYPTAALHDYIDEVTRQMGV